jgi:hypothetical protein
MRSSQTENYPPGIECRTVPDAGLAGKKNGELLSLAGQAGFQILLTVDQGIEYEQNLRDRTLSVVVIRVKSSRLHDLLPHVPAILKIVSSIQPWAACKSLLNSSVALECSVPLFVTDLRFQTTSSHY